VSNTYLCIGCTPQSRKLPVLVVWLYWLNGGIWPGFRECDSDMTRGFGIGVIGIQILIVVLWVGIYVRSIVLFRVIRVRHVYIMIGGGGVWSWVNLVSGLGKEVAKCSPNAIVTMRGVGIVCSLANLPQGPAAEVLTIAEELPGSAHAKGTDQSISTRSAH
jgi:hypothetical protein